MSGIFFAALTPSRPFRSLSSFFCCPVPWSCTDRRDGLSCSALSPCYPIFLPRGSARALSVFPRVCTRFSEGTASLLSRPMPWRSEAERTDVRRRNFLLSWCGLSTLPPLRLSPVFHPRRASLPLCRVHSPRLVRRNFPRFPCSCPRFLRLRPSRLVSKVRPRVFVDTYAATFVNLVLLRIVSLSMLVLSDKDN